MITSSKRFLAGLSTIVLLALNTAILILAPLGESGSDALLLMVVCAINYLFISSFSFYVFKYADNPSDSKSLFFSLATLCPVIVIVVRLLIYI